MAVVVATPSAYASASSLLGLLRPSPTGNGGGGGGGGVVVGEDDGRRRR